MLSKMLVQRIRPRLRMVYRIARLGKARLLLGARTFSKLAQRWQNLKHLARLDLKLLNNYQQIQLHLQKITAQAGRQRRKRLSLQKKLKHQQQMWSSMRKKARATLKKLYQEAQKYTKVIETLYGSQARFQKLLKSWQASRNLKGLWSFRGKLLWPIVGFSRRCSRYKLSWVKNYASLLCLKRQDTLVSMNDGLGRQGWQFSVPEGTPVRAVSRGKVLYSGWERGYGRLLVLDHGQRFYSVYAHFSQCTVQKGDVVESGRILGTVGHSGLLGKPRLYFELRFRARLLNPYNWLRRQIH